MEEIGFNRNATTEHKFNFVAMHCGFLLVTDLLQQVLLSGRKLQQIQILKNVAKGKFNKSVLN